VKPNSEKMKRYGDGPIDGAERNLWDDPINRESWSLTQTKDRLWTTHTLQSEVKDRRRVEFEIVRGNGRGYWRNPHLLLSNKYLDQKWTARWEYAQQVWEEVDSNLCLFLSKRVSSSPACGEIAIPFANNSPEPCISAGADRIIISFENGIPTDEIGLRIECCEASEAEASREAARRTILYEMHKIPLCGVVKWSDYLPLMHIGNCLIIHLTSTKKITKSTVKDQSVDDRNNYPFDSVQLFVREFGKVTERLFIEASSADIALKNRPGWFVLPMDALSSPEEALDSTDFTVASSLDASQCDIRIEFETTKDRPLSEWEAIFYWKHANVVARWCDLKYILFR